VRKFRGLRVPRISGLMLSLPRFLRPRASLLPLPRTPGTRAPGVPGAPAVPTSGMKPVLFGLSLVILGLALAIYLVTSLTEEGKPVWPEPGASYILPDSLVGEWLEMELEPVVSTPTPGRPRTLQVNLAAGALIDNFSFTDLSLGKTGLTTCFQVKRADSTTGFLHVGSMTLTNVSAPSFNMGVSEVGTLTLAGSADGRTNEATLDNTIGEQVILSTRGAGSFASVGSVDNVVINLLGSANVKTLSLTNVSCSVGGFDLDFIKAGTFVQDATSRFGTGTGINSPDYVLQSTLKYRISTDSMVDEPVTVR
jgi:hypothetical protein